MGAGASSTLVSSSGKYVVKGSSDSNASSSNGGSVDHKGSGDLETVVALSALGKRLRAFQHQSSGEIIILVDHDIKAIKGVIEKTEEWYEVHVSSKQSKYLETLKIVTMVPQIQQVSQVNVSTISGNSIASAAPAKLPAQSSEDINKVATKTEMLDEKASSPAAPWRNAKTKVNNATNETIGSPTISNNFGQQSTEQSTPDSQHNGAFQSNKRKSFVPYHYYPPSVQSSTNFATSFASDFSSNVGDENSSSAAEMCQHTSRDNSNPNQTDSRSSKSLVCKICNETINGGHNKDVYEEHINNCMNMMELRGKFSDIDRKLRPALFDLSQVNATQMESILNKAISTFDMKCLANNQVLRLLRKVMEVRYNDTDDKSLDQLHMELDDVLYTLQQRVADKNCDPENANEARKFVGVLDDAFTQLKSKRQLLRNYHRYYRSVSDFTFLRLLSRGAFAKVYLAQTIDSQQYYAIKVMDKNFVRQSKMEGQVKRELKIMIQASKFPDMFVRLFCSFQNDEFLFIAMEYVPGGDCLALLASMQRFPEFVAKIFIAEVSAAVRTLHEHGVIHRDIKPDNILITARGHVKLMDFGLSAPVPGCHKRNTKDSTSMASASVSYTNHSTSQTVSFSTGGGGGGDRGNRTGRSSINTANTYNNGGTTNNSSITSTNISSNNTSNNNLGNRSAKNSSQNTTSATITGGGRSKDSWIDNPSNDNPLGSTSYNTGWSSSSSSIFFKRHASFSETDRDREEVAAGNYHYCCPEVILKEPHDVAGDWWSVGVLFFHFLSGITPFADETHEKVLENIVSIKVNWSTFPHSCSAASRQLITDLLKNADERLGRHNDGSVLRHPYFAGIDFDSLYTERGPLQLHLQGNGDYQYFNLYPESEAIQIPPFQRGNHDSKADDMNSFNFNNF